MWLCLCVQIDRVTFGLLSPDDIERALRDDPHMPKSRKLLAVPFVVCESVFFIS